MLNTPPKDLPCFSVKLSKIFWIAFLTLGFEVDLGGLQSSNLHDHKPVGCEDDNGSVSGSFLGVANQQDFDQNALSYQRGFRLPHHPATESEGGRAWEKVS